MPARNVPRCPPKSAGDLGLLEELNVVGWIPLIPSSQFRNLEAMRAVWVRHRDRILPHYIACRPGTRPLAMYALGELPLPPLKHEPREHAMQTTIGDRTVYSPWFYFGERTGEDGHYCAGATWGEFQYLRRIGVVDAAEAKLAAAWVDDRHYDPTREDRPYVALSQ